MCDFVVLHFVSSVEIGYEERLQNDLFCVEWDVKTLAASILCCVLQVGPVNEWCRLSALNKTDCSIVVN